MEQPKNQAKSEGLGGAVLAFPETVRRNQPAPAELTPTPRLDLLKHIPDCAFKRYVEDVAKMTRIPANTSLLVGLGIVSSVSCRCYVTLYEERGEQPISLYVIVEHDSGTGKSWMLGTYQAPVFSSVKVLQAAWRDAFKAAKEKGEEARAEFLQANSFPTFQFDTDATPEGLDTALAETNGYFALASAEQGLANSISGAGYSNGERKSNKDLWLKGRNGEYHSSKRSKRTGYTGRVVGAVVNIAQPGIVQTILNHSENTGAAERCLMLSEPSMLGRRKHGREYRHYPTEGDQGHYNRIMEQLTTQAVQNAPFDTLPGFRFSRDDWDKMYALQNELEPHLADGGKYSTQTLRSMVAKADLQVMGIAVNLAILDDCQPGAIPSCWVDAAIGITRDMLGYVHRLLTEMGIIGMSAYEESVIAYLSDRSKQPTTRAFQTAKSKTKPWAEITPKSAIGETMRATFADLAAKGVIIKNDVGHYSLIA